MQRERLARLAQTDGARLFLSMWDVCPPSYDSRMPIGDESMNERQGRMQGADAVKGIATLLVLLTHYAWQDQERTALLFPFWVQVAVPAFMFVTGLVGAASLERARSSGGAWQLPWVVRRLVAWVMPLLVLCVVEALCYALRGEPFPFRVDQILLDGRAGPGGYYYLVLAQLALLLPVMFSTMDKRPQTGLLLWLFVDVLFESLCRRWGVGDPAYRVGALRYVFSVACGIHAYETRGRRLAPRLTIPCMAVGFAWLVATKYLGYWPHVVKAWYATSWVAALWSLPLLRWACLRWNGWRPLCALGRRSFSVFTVQVFFYRLVDDYVFAAIPSRIVQLVVCVAACLVFGLAFDALFASRLSQICGRVSARLMGVDACALDRRLGDLIFGDGRPEDEGTRSC